ncbi:flavoprotein-like protein [Mycena leptocephala]|nr:flavoprotein-like protein [Mycena leptocephala]
MCFPSKKQQANFDTAETTPTANPVSTKAPAPAATTPASAPLPTTEPTTETTVTEDMAGPKIAIVVYSMYGHITKMAEAVKKGIEESGGSATLYQYVAALLPGRRDAPAGGPHQDVRPRQTRLPHHHPDELAKYDAFIMGVPTRFGNFPAQWKAFWDSTSGLWASGALSGKYAGVFVSTAGPGGGQESTALATLSTLTHHGVIYLTGLTEVHGGSPWGAGTFAAADGSRQPTPLELEIATIQGKAFYGVVSKVKF